MNEKTKKILLIIGAVALIAVCGFLFDYTLY